MFNKILVAIDGSEISKYIFEKALDIAKANNAVLIFLHILSFEEQNSSSMLVSTSQEYFQTLDDTTLEIYRELWQTYKEKGLDMLRTHTNQALAAGVKTECTQVIGSPGRKICEFVDSFGIDLIVIGRRGFSGLDELFLRSVSNYVLHHAHCSVLTVQSILT